MFKLLRHHGCRSATSTLFRDKFEVRKVKTYYVYASAGSVRFSSSGSDAGKTTTLVDVIPEPPPVPQIPDGLAETVQSLAANGEPTFASLGLGGWSPVGMVQQCLEYVHVSLDIPWWGAILIGTIVVRIAMFPLVIMAQRNTAVMNNHLPEIQLLQVKMTQARQSGNQLEAARYAQEMMIFMKEKGLNPLKNMLVPLAQAPFFISFFMGLRGMANCPVESMTYGGLAWFMDLTVPDQYFLLPLITSATLWATIELGVDGGRLEASNMVMMRYFLRAIPIVMIPFTINFPGAILVYWCSSNFISLIQVGVLKIPAVREYLKIPKLMKHTPDTLPIKKKGFVEGAKDSWTNMKISKELAERQRVDELIFTKAGKGPLQKTYKFDPTKLSNVQAKSK
ncbi:mitochondrial inner membrane protein OXA1L-like [Leguminivora glycinivorella]|uniref:mitochondrial inner membrane protein OXA1L-like n=1 Tax=Leguminivora glycinivorella TaxID=1035111 RepID=UPI00200FF79E|nr:mitochondrial inner membrane protein OXA1L-like [Leguminivora glycinivorella]